MNLLVTGVAGFIGSNFVYYYLRQHPKATIVGLDKLTYAGNPENFRELSNSEKSRFTFIKGDICDSLLVNQIFEEYQIEGVINFSAESHVDRSISDPQIFLKTNILGTGILLDAAKKCWMRDGTWPSRTRFIQISTDEVYGSLGSGGYFSETTPLDPHSPYSASKAGADLIAKAYHDTFGMPVLITRCSNNYGPYQFPEKLIPLMIQNALNHVAVPVYGDGKQVRDWLYVKDHCKAIDLVLERGFPGEIYNIGGSNEWQNIDLVNLVIAILYEETGDHSINEDLITFIRDRPGHDRRYAIDASKIKAEIGWKPETPFQEGIRSTVRWYLRNRTWLEHVISGDYRKYYEEKYGNGVHKKF
jgi:dTDP-glucose 4,6-dehydratase